MVGHDLHKLHLEAGGHRIQRVPPSERKGRVHTSTVTVAVVDPFNAKPTPMNDADLKIEWFSGTGCGGQHRNRHKNSCRVTHIPTGVQETRQGRVRHTNLQEAKIALSRRIIGAEVAEQITKTAIIRKRQVGSGMRGDKTVTIRFQDDKAMHHETNKTMKASKYMKGFMDQLWE